MVPTIRVEHDVYRGLQQLGEPFVDTPNTVIRKLLEEKGILGNSQETRRASPGDSKGGHLNQNVENSNSGNKRSRAGVSNEPLTPQPVYEQWLLHTLYHKFGGRAEKAEVTRATIQAMQAHGLLDSADMEIVSTGETKAENTIAWGRNRLKDAGFISRISARGVWELTPEGKDQAKKIVLSK